MIKRILSILVLIMVLSLCGFSLIASDINYNSFIEKSKEHLKVFMNVYNNKFSLDDDGATELSQQLDNIRVTFMGLDGAVIGDSALKNLDDNYINNEEVSNAVATGEGFATRTSKITKKNTIYYCKRFEADKVLVRISLPTVFQWEIFLKSAPTVCWVVMLDIIICVIFTYLATSFILKPVEKLTKESVFHTKITTKDQALKPIVDIINKKNEEINEKILEINEEKNLVIQMQNSKNDFIANITHEMNTPLTSINGFAEILINEELSQEQQNKAVNTILKQSQRLIRLIACIINYNQIDTDLLPSYDTNLTHCALGIIDMLELQQKEKK